MDSWSGKIRKTESITLHTDEGLPVVRGGASGRGRVLARGTALAEGATPESNAAFIRQVLELPADRRVYIRGQAY